MIAGEFMWADWRALIESEINKVSRRRHALQRPLNDLYDEDHQGFVGLVVAAWKVVVVGLNCLMHFVVVALSFLSVCVSPVGSLVRLSVGSTIDSSGELSLVFTNPA